MRERVVRWKRKEKFEPLTRKETKRQKEIDDWKKKKIMAIKKNEFSFTKKSEQKKKQSRQNGTSQGFRGATAASVLKVTRTEHLDGRVSEKRREKKVKREEFPSVDNCCKCKL